MNTLGKIYLFTALIFSILFNFWGERSYRGYFFNLGMALVWPVSIFKYYPELDGSNQLNFGKSFLQVVASGDSVGQVYFYESFGALTFYFYAKTDSSVTSEDYTNIQNDPAALKNFIDALMKDSKITDMLAAELDGMTLGDVVRNHDSYYQDLQEILSSRSNNTKPIVNNDIKTTENIGKDKAWRSAWAQGINEYISENSDGTLIIYCPDFEGPVKATFESGQKTYYSHDSNKNFDMVIDGEQFQNPFFTDCHVCADNFPYFWNKLMNAQEIKVSTDGKLHEINVSGLKGTILPLDSKDNACRTEFY